MQILIVGATGFNGSAAAPPPLGRVCDPARKPVTAAGAFISENLTALKNFAEYVAPGELKSVEELKPGCGAIVRDGLKKVAAYRDKSGSLHLHSAACHSSRATSTGTRWKSAGIAHAAAIATVYANAIPEMPFDRICPPPEATD